MFIFPVLKFNPVRNRAPFSALLKSRTWDSLDFILQFLSFIVCALVYLLVELRLPILPIL